MRLKMTNIKPNYAEIWGNKKSGQRYVKLAVVLRDEGGQWVFSSNNAHASDFGRLPPFTYEFDTRREAVAWVKRWYLKRQLDRAIEEQTEPSRFWRCPRRDAFADMWDSGLFSYREISEANEMINTYGGEGA